MKTLQQADADASNFAWAARERAWSHDPSGAAKYRDLARAAGETAAELQALEDMRVGPAVDAVLTRLHPGKRT